MRPRSIRLVNLPSVAPISWFWNPPMPRLSLSRSRLSRLSRCLPPVLLLFSTVGISGAETEKVATGKIVQRSYHFREADKQMKYSLYLPTGYTKDKAFPLVVALHGLGSSDRGIIRYRGFVRHAEKHGYIIVAPMGYNSRGWYGMRGFSSFSRRRGDPKNLGELSEKDVMNVLAIVRKEFHIDNDRIYLMGHSMGGGGTFHLGIKYPKIWAALGPIAPACPRSTKGLKEIPNMPVIVVQGDKDRLVYGTRRWVAAMKRLKMECKYIEVKGGGHVDVAFQHFPQLFEFFNTHTRKTHGKKKATAKPESKPAKPPARDKSDKP